MACRLLICTFVNPRLRRVLPSLLVGLLAAAQANASVARAVGFQEKVDAADAIVLGKVVSTETGWDPSRRWIVTRSTLQVEKALKGTPASQLTVVTPGGSIDGIRQETIGVPSFTPGDEHVVFVRSTANGPTVAFFEQGVFDVTRDGRGRPIIEPIASELVLVDDQTGRAAAPDSTALTLEAFERKVADAVEVGTRRRHAMDAGSSTTQDAADGFSGVLRGNRTLILLGALAAILLFGVILYRRS
jgi:hypothetical protein